MKAIVNRKLYLMLFALCCLVFLLFFAESNYFSTRSWRHAWDLGHVALFILAGYVVFQYFSAIHDKTLGVQFLMLAAMAFFSGLGIEYLQSFVGRQASLQDVMLDVTGAIVSVALFSHRIRILNLYQKVWITFSIASLILFTSWTLITSLWDEYHARREFPVLADFERAWEIARWTSIEKMEVSDEVSMTGHKSLKVSLTPRSYSGIELQYFPGDWSGYDYLMLQAFNPESVSVSLTVSIYDYKHIANQFEFTDRYTKRYKLRHGWNEVNVSLHDVKHAPRNREMDTSRISGLRLFMRRPRKQQQLYIDGVRLEK